MKWVVQVFPAAEADVKESAAFIARDNPAAAQRFYESVTASLLQLGQAPEQWPLYQSRQAHLAGIRKRSVQGFGKYLIFYRIAGNLVHVIRVLHGARDVASILARRRKWRD